MGFDGKKTPMPAKPSQVLVQIQLAPMQMHAH